MASIFDDPESILGTVAQLLAAEGSSTAVSVLRSAQSKFEETGYDNWNGGTTIYTLYLRVDPAAYAALGASREQIEIQIAERLKPIIEQITDDWITVKIAPLITKNPEWRSNGDDIPRVIRQDIFDIFRVSNIAWSGALDDVEFLERIFDLKSLPSTDSRFKDAAGDIWQHRINNPMDWDDDWVFGDGRFNLLEGPHEIFLKFICETIHPAVRKDRAQSIQLVQQFNQYLKRIGWQIIEEETVAGYPRYKAQKINSAVGLATSRAKTVADALDAGWMHKEIVRLESAVEKDPGLAIGTAKDLVESCCKTILKKIGVDIPKGTDFPALTKMTVKELKLVPENISEAAKGAEKIKIILSNLSALTHGLAELRGLYGSGHGRDGKYRGLEARHARLAVGAAVAFIDFVTETYHQRLLEHLESQPNQSEAFTA